MLVNLQNFQAAESKMHYIRFVKTPRIVTEQKKKFVVAKITVTTDLGESFCRDPVDIRVALVHNATARPEKSKYVWLGRDGRRELEIREEINENVEGGIKNMFLDIWKEPPSRDDQGESVIQRETREESVNSFRDLLGLDDYGVWKR